jgi:hypothetical protein
MYIIIAYKTMPAVEAEELYNDSMRTTTRLSSMRKEPRSFMDKVWTPKKNAWEMSTEPVAVNLVVSEGKAKTLHGQSSMRH